MKETGSRPEPPVLKQEGFELRQGRFSASNIDRFESLRLKQLFHPEILLLKPDIKEAQESAKILFKKTFFAAQLRHYGIKVASSATVSKHRDLLEDAVRQGKCDRVPESVIRLEESMRRDYEPLQHAWESDVHAYEANKKQKNEEEFAKCTTAGQRASLDADRFMDFYFLTDGQPDRGKTTEPLALYGLNDRRCIHIIATRVAGLHTISGGNGTGRTLCIGWDWGAVWSLARGIGDEADKTRKRRQDDQWENAMESHRQHMKLSSQGPVRQNRKESTDEQAIVPSFELHQCQGSYIVQCDAVRNGWPESCEKNFTLDIRDNRDGTLTADFHFGIIEGTMLLGLSKEKLDVIVGPGEDCGHDGNNKRKRRRLQVSMDKRSRDAGHETKNSKLVPSLSRRVYYRLQGRETGDGQRLRDIESGHLDFLTNRCGKFEGLAYFFPYIDKNIEFRGFKVSDKLRQIPSEWVDYSGKHNPMWKMWH